MLGKEKNYDFRKRMLQLHKPNIRDCSRICAEGELELRNGVTIIIPDNPDKVVLTAAEDFLDFLFTSMNVSAGLCMESASENISDNFIYVCYAKDKGIELTEGKGYMGYRIKTENHIEIAGFDSRGIAQAFYYLEDVIKLAKAPFVEKGIVEKKALFSPRIVHSGYEICKFPSEHLASIAHAGMDAIAVFTQGHDLDLKGLVDFGELIHRAEKYGIDVYIYSNMKSALYPEGDEAERYYDGLYGKLFERFPSLRGVILCGESVEFPSKDPHVRSASHTTPYPDNIPDGKINPGWWPCVDYPLFVNMLKKVIRKHREDADIVFWSYNWCSRPEEDRLSLIRNLPTDISLMVTYELGERFDIGDGIIENSCDYTLSLAGPSKYFVSEAKTARECGIRLYAMSNTAGQTWDFGVIPYEPMPYQWIKRYEGLKKAREEWGLCGLLEGHHYGFFPSFISELAKWSFFSKDTPYDEILLKLMARDCGEENASSVVEGLKKWSEAITWYISTDNDQYGGFRIGPAFPFCMRRAITPPENKYAVLGGSIYDAMHQGLTYGAITPYAVRIHKELKNLREVERCMAEGLELMKSCSTKEGYEEFLRLINLGEFILCCVRTVINVKRWFILRQSLYVESDRDKLLNTIEEMEKVIDDEIINAQNAIPLVEADSRLGWEPSMEYQSDAEHIRWKIKEVNYAKNTELALFRSSILAKIN